MRPPLDFLNLMGTERPLRTNGKVRSNETNTAQSYRFNPSDLAPPELASAPTPRKPAAPMPKPSPEASDAQKKRDPLVWIGLAAGLVLLFWMVRRA